MRFQNKSLFQLTALAASMALTGLVMAQEQVIKIGHVGPISGAIAAMVPSVVRNRSRSCVTTRPTSST